MDNFGRIYGFGWIKYDPPRPNLKEKIKHTGSSNRDRWCIVHVDKEITRYFRYWVNKKVLNPLGLELQRRDLLKYPFVELMPPSWDAHISVIRGEVLDPNKSHLWKKYDGMKAEFYYDLNVKQAYDYRDKERKLHYWYVTVDAPELLYIRREFGLKSDWPLHITIGRTYDFQTERFT